MSVQHDSLEKEELRKEISRLILENKKLNRQLTLANNMMEKLRNVTNAKANLSAVIAAEKNKQDKHIQVIIDNTPIPIVLFDSETIFILSTQSFLFLAGIENAGFLRGKTFRQVLSLFSEDSWITHMEKMFDIALKTNEIQASDEKIDFGFTGNPRNYAISIVPFSYGETVNNGILLLMNDLTDLIKARDQAKAASIAKSNFLATMSHEIRTPMNAIIGMADMLEKTSLDEEQKFLSVTMKNSSKALLSLVNDILDFSKIEAGKIELTEGYFDVFQMIEHIKSVFSVLFVQKGLGFRIQVDVDVPHVIFADEDKMKQIITNLLSNALKYTNEGYVVLRVTCRGEKIRFDVEDTGIGIKEENIGRLFEPFEQFDKVVNKNIVGTGLGLPITHRLCRIMKGNLDVRTTYGSGSVFTASFPLIEGNASDIQGSEFEFVHFTAPGASVLVVDDIEINLLITQALLEEYGMEVTVATGGYKAIELAKQATFDIVFMDHMMPEIDGVETTLELRKLGGPWATIPIIALTANATVEAQEMFLRNKLNDFIAKPVDTELLNVCLHKWLPEDKIVFAAKTS